MENVNPAQGNVNWQQPATEGQRPAFLNVLTILTYIGCAFTFLGSIWGFIRGQSTLDQMETLRNSDKFEQMPSFLQKFYSLDYIEMLRKSVENKIPILLISIAAALLCFFGAMQMRQLKKQGFLLWLLGEILPIVGTVIFIGSVGFTGISQYFGYFFILLFIVMYATQVKYLK